VIRLGKAGQTQPAVPAPASAPPAAPAAEILPETAPEETREAPMPAGELAPDQTVEPPPAEPRPARAKDKTAGEESGTPGPRDLGPIHARIVKEQEEREALERSKMWAEMRHRERVAGFKEQKPATKSARKPFVSSAPSSSRGLPWGIILKVLGAVAVLALMGGGVYYLFFMQHDIQVTAAEVWDEYSKDTPAANQKYKGKFVRITGKLKVYSAPGKTTHYFFETPENAKWGIEFVLQAKDIGQVKDGDELTLRCRFGTRREPDGNLMLSNCALVTVK
jgi:hypothetical protein